ncbi:MULTISPECIES: Uma2 family endonuclease [Capnocytophaga]|uniref:Restriction endonuclease n=2 Tax=Capnocytophaga TaxID=1016 RepID=A0A1Z4BL86_9FLAO|nr:MULTISPECIES: Uma2 family endonuclease [Capnocytophaga]ASF42043.1 restriction endonuclease [Capnocytophaga endodontalis]
MTITNINQLDPINGLYTYAEYLLWKFEERVELLKGKLFKMSAPSPAHQVVQSNLNIELGLYFRNQKCQIYPAPFDVRLPAKGETGDAIHTVVQPDLCVVCDRTKIDSRGCIGAPDLVIEIISPGNSKKELKQKFKLYEEAGVREYWVIHPTEEYVIVNVLENNHYKTLSPIVDDEVHSVIFPTLKVHTKEIFRN